MEYLCQWTSHSDADVVSEPKSSTVVVHVRVPLVEVVTDETVHCDDAATCPIIFFNRIEFVMVLG